MVKRELPAHWAVSQSIPTASKANSVTILANRNWKLPRKFKTDWAVQRTNHLFNTLSTFATTENGPFALTF